MCLAEEALLCYLATVMYVNDSDLMVDFTLVKISLRMVETEGAIYKQSETSMSVSIFTFTSTANNRF